jgi:hypothetical protein
MPAGPRCPRTVTESSQNDLGVSCGMTKKRFSEDELIEALKGLAELLGRTPRARGADADPRVPCHSTFVNRFGSWRKALETAGIPLDPRNAGYDRETLLKHLQDLAETLVRRGTSEPLVQAASGRPVWVHLNGLANVLLKYSMSARIRWRRSSGEEKLARLSSRRTKILNQMIALSASSCGVQCVTGRPDSCGSSQATAMIWPVCSGSNVLSAPGRGSSGSTCSIDSANPSSSIPSSSASNKAGAAAAHRSRQMGAVVRWMFKPWPTWVLLAPSAASNTMSHRRTSRWGLVSRRASRSRISRCLTVNSIGVGLGPACLLLLFLSQPLSGPVL